jgi:hypothetical protein
LRWQVSMKKCSYCGRDNTDEALRCNECGTEFEREVMDSESTSDGPHNEVKTVTIRIFVSHDDAELAAANLEAHGIQCWINSDDGGGALPYLTAPGGVRLLVRASDAEAAIALLNAETPNQSDHETNVPSDTTPENKNSFVPIAIVVGIVVLLCLLYVSRNKSTGKDNLGTTTQYIGATTQYHYAQDGRPDEAWIYQNGHLMEYREDRNHDGNWDHWVYYEHGQEVRSDYDNNFDGKADEWWTFSDGGTDTFRDDTDYSGIPDVFGTYKNKIIQQMDIKPNGSKFTTTREIFKNGVLTEILRGGDSNGNFKEDVRYDPFFNPISTNVPAALQLSPSPK